MGTAEQKKQYREIYEERAIQFDSVHNTQQPTQMQTLNTSKFNRQNCFRRSVSSAVLFIAIATYAIRLLSHAHISHIFLRCLSKLIFVIFSLLLLRFAFHPSYAGFCGQCVCVCVQLTFAYLADAGSNFYLRTARSNQHQFISFRTLKKIVL